MCSHDLFFRFSLYIHEEVTAHGHERELEGL